ncbi:MAG: flagellar basal body-associated FliL family protein [Cryobacterium sp.]|nr:flagellar basal body-associated FliL family protein [Oligoflexia bacterium]
MSALKAVPGQIKEGFQEAWIGLRSPDWPTRRMAVVFFLSIAGVLFTLGAFGKFWLANRARQHEIQVALQEKAAADSLKAQEAKKALEPPPYQTLGTFSLELREGEGVARSSGLRAAEMEIVVACSSLEVCDWIKAHVDLSRGSLGALFTPTDRERILSLTGKKAFREEIRDVLNRLLEERGVKGSILEVLFPRFIVS